jgi:hypothetical protein
MRRVIGQSSSNKIQIDTRLGSANKLVSAIGCSLNYQPIVYNKITCCLIVPPPPPCYSLPTLNGGQPNTTPTLVMDGGTPNFTGLCKINPSECYTNPVLNGGQPNTTPTLFMDGGTPNFIGLCKINPSECYTNPILNGGQPNTTPTLFMDGGTPNFIGPCKINFSDCYTNSVLNGGVPNNTPTNFMSGGTPNFTGVCRINPFDILNYGTLVGNIFTLTTPVIIPFGETLIIPYIFYNNSIFFENNGTTIFNNLLFTNGNFFNYGVMTLNGDVRVGRFLRPPVIPSHFSNRGGTVINNATISSDITGGGLFFFNSAGGIFNNTNGIINNTGTSGGGFANPNSTVCGGIVNGFPIPGYTLSC